MVERRGIDALGIPWYKRSDYPRIIEVMADRHLLPTTFDKWQTKAEGFERNAKASGKVVVRGHIDPDQFVAWCEAKGLYVDAHARGRWASEAAYWELTGGQN